MCPHGLQVPDTVPSLRECESRRTLRFQWCLCVDGFSHYTDVGEKSGSTSEGDIQESRRSPGIELALT